MFFRTSGVVRVSNQKNRLKNRSESSLILDRQVRNQRGLCGEVIRPQGSKTESPLFRTFDSRGLFDRRALFAKHRSRSNFVGIGGYLSGRYFQKSANDQYNPFFAKSWTPLRRRSRHIISFGMTHSHMVGNDHNPYCCYSNQGASFARCNQANSVDNTNGLQGTFSMFCPYRNVRPRR